MVNFGAKVMKHEDNAKSAHKIIRILLHKKKTALKMQVELDQNDGILHATSAAQQLYRDLGAISEVENRRLQELTRELRFAREERGQLLKELKELREKVEILERQKEKLKGARVSHSIFPHPDDSPTC